MAFDAFLKLDGIEGESTDAHHKGWIDVLSYSLGGSSGRRSLHDFHIVKSLDKASPRLFAASCNGESAGTAVFSTSRQAGDGSVHDFLKVTLAEVVIASVTISGQAGEEPTEQLTLRFKSAGLTVAGAADAGACVPGPGAGQDHGPGHD